jgi:hypothetical protein
MKKTFIFLIFISNSGMIFSQVKGYSKFLDINKNQFDEVLGSTGKIGDDIVIRLMNSKINNDTLSTSLVKYNTQYDSISSSTYYKDVQAGITFTIQEGKLLLSNENKPNLDAITVASINAKTLHKDTIIALKIPKGKYFDHYITKSILYNNKHFIGARTLNKEKFIPYLGWNQYEGCAVFFVLNKNLKLDTMLIYPPTEGGAFLKIEDLDVGPDSVLYVTFYERYLKQIGINTPFLESRKVIYGIDKNYKTVFKWLGVSTNLSPVPESMLAIDKNNIKYFDYKDEYRHHVLAINPDSSIKWHILIDSSYQRTYNFNSLKIAKDGNLLAAGFADSGLENIAESGYAIKINAATGKIIWQKVFRVNNNHDKLGKDFWWPFRTDFQDIEELPNGDLIMVGNVREYDINTPPNQFPYDHKLWVVRTDKNGCLYENCRYIQDIVSKKYYIPYVSPRNEWIADTYHPNPAIKFIRRSFSKDSTLLNGKYYRSLMYSYEVTGVSKSAGIFMREEHGAVYEYNAQKKKESLIYNMNYSIGDTIAGNPNTTQPAAMVVDVGVYNLLDKIPRKYYKYVFKKSCPDTITVMEGFGDTQGFWARMGHCSLFDGEPESIRCFSVDGQLLYKRSDVGGCFISPTKDLVNERLKISPNPVTDILNIQYTNNQSDVNFDFTITDLSGSVLLKSTLTSNNDKIDISSFQNGFYFITFFENNRFITTKRFVKAD